MCEKSNLFMVGLKVKHESQHSDNRFGEFHFHEITIPYIHMCHIRRLNFRKGEIEVGNCQGLNPQSLTRLDF